MTGRQITEHAVEVLPADAYLTDEWYEARRKGISASEIAAVIGLSPYTSRFDLFWQKRTGVDSQDENRDMRRGHRYERLILEDFGEEHPEFAVRHAGLCRNVERSWQMCSPDGLAYESQLVGDYDGFGVELAMRSVATGDPVALVEAKSAADRREWGDAGTDEIPVYYRAQVQWSMDALGLNVAYVPVVFGFEYREYVVEYDEADVKLLREAAEEFLADVDAGRQPAIDSHRATRRRLQKLHPDLVDEVVDVPPTIIRQYLRAKALRDAAQDRIDLATNRLRYLMGPAKRATAGPYKVSHSIYDMAERIQPACRVDKLNMPRKERSE